MLDQLRRKNDQSRQSHPQGWLFVILKLEKIFIISEGGYPPFLGITSQGNIFIRMDAVFLLGGKNDAAI